MSQKNTVVSHEQWTAARIDLLRKEKEFSRLRDQLSQQVRSMPWKRVEKNYIFDAPKGAVGLADLFGSKSQLIVYHFMFDPSWDQGCPSCSLITDSLDPTAVHLGARDVSVALVSRAPLEKLLPFKARMGWQLNWVSSHGSDFNRDFQVSTGEVTSAGEFYYNYEKMSSHPVGELPGLSVFSKNSAGQVFHTYSTYARGLENFLGTYPLLDVVPKGRNEEGLAYGMEWVRHRDSYEESSDAGAAGCCEG